MATTLLVPDVHERIHPLQAILRAYASVPRVILLGDWVDSFDGLTGATHETARWLAENSHNSRDWVLGT